jgi:8-oxo-dGTP pyrophosphatase MutT (NUDIX family)
MGMSDYVRRLREKIGNDLLLMPSTHCVIRDADGRLLLVRHVEGRWMLPGGAIEPGETPADAARRECWEEASVLVEPFRVVGVYGGPEYGVTYANGDRTRWVVTIFEARILSGEPRAGDDETQDVGWFAAEELGGLEVSPATRRILECALGDVPFLAAEWLPD